MKGMRPVLALVGCVLLAACSRDKNVEPPAELVDIRPTLDVREVWTHKLGGGGEKLRLALGLALDDGTLYAAGRDGDVEALQAESGRSVWRTDTKIDLSAGPAVGEGLVVVGTNDGDLIALDSASGERKWKVQLSGEVLARPLIAAGLVVVRTVDGRLQAVGAADGVPRWSLEEQVPRLSLRGTAAPVRVGDTVVCGFDNGKVVAASLASGEILWQAQLTVPKGRSELERLADVDAAVQVSGEDVYAVGYHGRAAMLSLDSGQVWWGREVSSYRGLSLDGDQLYVSSADGEVIALSRRDGTIAWEQKGLLRRGLSAPAVDGAAVVVGDYDGYLHWMDRNSGTFVARKRLGGERVAAQPLVGGGMLFALDEGGKIGAYRSGAGADR
jgi:outer membrane protein assembly factor BamB